MTAPVRHDRLEGLPLALAAALLLLVASFWNWAAQWGGTLANGNAFEAMQNGGSIWGSRLGWQFIAFGLAQLALHLGFGAACWALARVARSAWPDYPASQRTWVVLWLMLGVLWVLVANAALYPRSTFGDHLYRFAQAEWRGVMVFHAASALLAGFVLLALGSAARRALGRAAAPSRTGWIAGGALALLASGMAVVQFTPAEARPVVAAGGGAGARPHVILLGLDSLRCDVTRVDGRDGLAPNVDRFLADATRFTDAMTPLARTYPSWISVLTGKHPHTTGAFVNLLHRDQMQLGDNLPEAMRRAGYRTVYAIDEARFSNIDETYGFDHTITPPIGAADFLIGAINDAPLSNVIVNTWLGRWLFPYSHANRAAATLYDPDSYVERLQRELEFGQPTFLVLHLTLAHWPYTWATAKPADVQDPANWTAAHYRPAVRRLDQQFADVLEVLRAKGALDNAIVVLLSDHGEAVGLPDDSPWSMTGPVDDPYAWPVITGHGTSVLSPHQYRVVLAMRGFGPAAASLGAPREIGVPSSLEDVAPTLNDWLGLQMADRFDGRSLLPLLRREPQAAEPFTGRIRFTETEFNPRGFMPGQKQTTSAVEAAMRFYEIDRDNGRMNIRRGERAKLLQQRQYAAIRGGETVAAVPGYYSPGFRFIHIDAAPGSLPRALDARPDPLASPGAAELWDALQQRFGASLPGKLVPAPPVDPLLPAPAATARSAGPAAATRVARNP
jgi:arylsulfatase A-like enzyme